MAKNTYKQDEVLEEPFDIKHLLRASSYIKKYAKRMVFAILLSGIGGASGYVAPMIIQWVREVGYDNYPAGAGPCNSGEKREAFIFSCGNAGRHLSGERDLHNNPKPHYGGCQSEYHL